MKKSTLFLALFLLLVKSNFAQQDSVITQKDTTTIDRIVHAPSGQMLGNGDIGYTIPAEFVDSIFHKKGTLCAARTENPEKASSGCQFYIVQGQKYTPEQLTMMEMQRHLTLNDAQKNIYMTLGGTPMLDHLYTVFGEVIEGLDVIDKIAAVQTAPGDRPVQDVRMYMKVVQ